MTVRWSPLAVSDFADHIDAEIERLIPPLEAAKTLTIDARQLPNLPGYMDQQLHQLYDDLNATLARLTWKLRRVREVLPQADLNKEKHRLALNRRLEEA